MSFIKLFEKNNKIIINSDIDGVLSGLFLKQYCNCEIVGFSNSANKVWINQRKINSIYDAIYVDMYVADPAVTCIDQHIIGLNPEHNAKLSENQRKLNPNLLLSRSHTPAAVYRNKYPLGTVHFIIAALEKEGLNLALQLGKEVSNGIKLIDLILRADDAMHTTVATTFKTNADTWWNWLFHYSKKGSVTEELISYMQSLSAADAKTLKLKTANFLQQAPYYCESGDGGFKSILTQEGKLKKTLKFYVDMLAKSMNVNSFYFGQEYTTFEGRLDRITLNDSQKQELIDHHAIDGQKIFSYAFIWGENKEGNFSYTVM